MKLFITLFLIITFSDCTAFGNVYKKYYKSIPENENKVILLNKGEKPQIYNYDYRSSGKTILEGMSRIDGLRATIESQGYILIGYSSFNSGYNKYSSKILTKHAKKIGATVAVATSQLTGTTQQVVPSNNTTNHSGTINNSSFNSTSTTQSTKVVKYGRFDHYAVFYAKAITPKKTIGLFVKELNETDKAINARNTGAAVSGVGDKSPAFYANVLKKDIIIKVNEKDVYDVAMAQKLFSEIHNDDIVNLTVVRMRQEKVIQVIMNPMQ